MSRSNNIVAVVLLSAGVVYGQPCPEGEWCKNPANGHEYRLTDKPGTWDEAEEEAVATGGHLVTINDATENQWVFDRFCVGSVPNRWIGFHQDKTDPDCQPNCEPDDGWKWVEDPTLCSWVTGNPDVCYANWIAGEPNDNGGENWAQIKSEPSVWPSQWNDVNQEGSTLRGIIEREAGGQTVLWAQYAQPAPKGEGQIQFVSLDCPEKRTVAQGRTPWDVAFDPIAEMVYWSDVLERRLYRANLDGRDDQMDVEWRDVVNPRGVKLDLANQHIYWSTSDEPREIRRSDLDPTSPSELLIDLDNPSQVNWIDLDLVNGKIYYTDDQTSMIYRANLDGTDIETCLSGRVGLADIATDPSSGKVYWAEAGGIYVGDLACPIKNISPLIPGTFEPYTGLELDLAAGKIYWTEYTNKVIRCANLSDGSDDQPVWETCSNPVGITLISVVVPLFADICRPYCPDSCPQPDLDDILCVLDDFADGPDVDGCGCDGFRNTTDLHPCPEDGGGDGSIGLDDILKVLDAFGGLNPCDDPCP